jgi:hypothetical protein
MTYTRQQKFDKFQRDVLDQLNKTNALLEKITALLVSDQLLQECVSPDGEARTAAECAEIITDSYCAGLCLAEELNDRNREFAYQKSEFFVDSDDEEEDDEEEANDDDDDIGPPPTFQMAF